MRKKLLIGLSVGGLTLLALGLVACFVYPVIYNNVRKMPYKFNCAKYKISERLAGRSAIITERFLKEH